MKEIPILLNICKLFTVLFIKILLISSKICTKGKILDIICNKFGSISKG